MAEVYEVKVEASFLVLADDHHEAQEIASVLTDGIDLELPGDTESSLYSYRILRQDDYMRKRCVNYEGHADNQPPTAVSAESAK